MDIKNDFPNSNTITCTADNGEIVTIYRDKDNKIFVVASAKGSQEESMTMILGEAGHIHRYKV